MIKYIKEHKKNGRNFKNFNDLKKWIINVNVYSTEEMTILLYNNIYIISLIIVLY